VVTEVGLVCGIDEAGRGPLAGPVVAAAVLLAPDRPIAGLRDSKRLSAAQRERLAVAIRDQSLAWALGRAEAAEIDRLNILRATLLAMRRALDGLAVRPARALVDGNRCPELPCDCEAVVRGDARVPAISAASILAKVARDAEMLALDRLWPGYGFAVHKGYPTRLHLEALVRLGPSAVHRRSFGPVRRLLDQAEEVPGHGDA
jgi:ribonuclease HII